MSVFGWTWLGFENSMGIAIIIIIIIIIIINLNWQYKFSATDEKMLYSNSCS